MTRYKSELSVAFGHFTVIKQLSGNSNYFAILCLLLISRPVIQTIFKLFSVNHKFSVNELFLKLIIPVTLYYTTVSSSVYSNSSCSFVMGFFGVALLKGRLLLNSKASPSSKREQYPEAS